MMLNGPRSIVNAGLTTMASWFRPKGYGLVPATWQGWILSLIIFPLVAIVVALVVGR